MATHRLKKTLSLPDATSIGVGAIVGAGIFAVLGAATNLAGPAVVFSILLAAAVAMLTAHSFVRLSRSNTREGGAYEFARELLSPFEAFITGFLWLASNVVAGAVVALAFSHYLSAVFPLFPVIPAAVAICIAATAVNYFGMKESVSANNLLVAAKLLTLLFFICAGLLFFRAANFSSLFQVPLAGVISGAAVIFFAYGGFARITVVSEEVKDARNTVPAAILLSLAISSLLYVLVSVAAVGLPDSAGAASSGAFLSQAISSTGIPYAPLVVSLGALAATGSVLLTTILGVSRVLFAMSRNGDAPALFSRIDPSSGIPRNAVLAAGAASCLLALLGDLVLVASVSSFAMLLYYAAANYSAIRLKSGKMARLLSIAALASCLALAAFLSQQSLLVGALAILCGAAYYYLRGKKGK